MRASRMSHDVRCVGRDPPFALIRPRRRPSAIGPSALGLAGCVMALALLADPARGERGGSQPAGTASVSSRADVPGGATAADTVRWTVREDLSIGMLDGPEAYTFGRVRGVLVSDCGEIVVLEAGDGTIRVFSPEGKFLR